MISYGQQHIDEKDIRAVVRALRSPFITQGPEVLRFEKSLAKKSGVRFAVAVGNGTVALEIAYRAAGIKAGDEVITTPNTFVATSNMLLQIGAKPVFCDIREDNYNIDETKIEALVTKNTSAIVPVHFAGRIAEMETINRIAKRHGLMVIADGAQVLGATYSGKLSGVHAPLTTLSFHAVKSITTGEGGAILTNNEKLYRKLLLLRSHGVSKDKVGFNVMSEFGVNGRLTDIQAALGSSQLEKLASFMKKRRTIAKTYYKLLSKVSEVVLPSREEKGESSWHLFVIRTKDAKDRLPLYRFLRKKEIGVNFHYPAVYAHPYYRNLGFRANCSVMDEYAKAAITIPLHVNLSEKEIAYVAASIKEFFAKK